MDALRLDAAKPGTIELLLDRDALSLWELVRIQRAAVGVGVLASISRRSAKDVQAALDRLIALGLLRVARARGKRREVGYRVVSDRVMLTFRPDDAATVERLKAIRVPLHKAHFEDLVASAGSETANHDLQWRVTISGLAHFEVDDLRELSRRIAAVQEFADSVGNRRSLDHTAADGSIRPPYANHAISIRVEPLEGPVLSLPTIEICREDSKRGRQPTRSPAAGALSARERHVVDALANGSTQLEVAKILGIAASTVSTLAQRAYRKLGVRNRAELVRALAKL